jgi:hypothetical protein
MQKRISPTTQDSSALQPNLHPVYVPPRITSYTSQEIIELIGPAQACSPNPCPTADGT